MSRLLRVVVLLCSALALVPSRAVAAEGDVPSAPNVMPRWNVGGDLGVYSRDEAGGLRGSFFTFSPRLTLHAHPNVGGEFGYGLTPAPALIPGPAIDATYHRLFLRAFARLPVEAGGVLFALGPALHLGSYAIRDATRVVESGTTLLAGVSGGLFYEHALGRWGLRTGLEVLWTPFRWDVAVVLGGSWGLEGGGT